MPSFNIHLAVAKRYLDKHNDIKNTLDFYKGSIAPDLTDNKDKSHYTAPRKDNELYSNYLMKKVILNRYLEENDILTDYDKGVFLHLITDKIFFTNYFTKEYVDSVIGKTFLNNLYFSYDTTNKYLEDKYGIGMYDVLDEETVKGNIKNNLKAKNVTDGDGINILLPNKLDDFIEKVSDINLEDYKIKVLNDDTHQMKLNNNAFNRMKKGDKKREYRANDEKRRKVKRGDIITFRKLPDLNEKLDMLVTDVQVYKDFREAVTPYFEEDFSDRHNDINSLVESFYSKGYYNKDEVEKYGTVVFTLARID